MRAAACMLVCVAAAMLVLRYAPGIHVVELPAGIVELTEPVSIPDGAHDFELRGTGNTVLHASSSFRGTALIVVRHAARVYIRNLVLDGNRDALELRTGLPPSDVPFARFTHNNGILAQQVTGLIVRDVAMRNIAGFAVLASRCRDVTVERTQVTDSGSHNTVGRNNATGGILLEEGTVGFRVVDCVLKNIRGNGIWTHSLYTSPQNSAGLIARNHIEKAGRDAIQVGHATRVRVEGNSGVRIGYPMSEVDIEGVGIPAALDTAGNTSACVYTRNRFEHVNGKCIDLDGFHDGEVRANVCKNSGAAGQYPLGNYGIVMNNSNPDMRTRNILITENVIEGAVFGGIFVIGSGHTIAGNRLLNVNTAHCNDNPARVCVYDASQPDLLRSGIYLGRGAHRPDPASGNMITGNTVTGYSMATHCVVTAPGIAAGANQVSENFCPQ